MKVKVRVEALIEVPDDQTDTETMDNIFTSGLGPEDKVEIKKVAVLGIVQQD